MKAPSFTYARPSTVAECLDELAGGKAVKVLAGGQSLLPLLNLRLARPGRLLDVNRIDALSGLEADDSGVTIGALVRHRSLETNLLLRERLPIVGRVSREIGFLAIRNRGSLGGSLAHADPAGELPALMALLGAEVRIRSAKRGERTVSVPRLVIGMLTTTLEEDELIVDVRVPWPSAGEVHGFWELVNRSGDFARVGAMVRVKPAVDGESRALNLVLFGSELPRFRYGMVRLGEGGDIVDAALTCCRELLAEAEPLGDAVQAARWAEAATRRAVSDALEAHDGEEVVRDDR